jgi:hypothetical protein
MRTRHSFGSSHPCSSVGRWVRKTRVSDEKVLAVMHAASWSGCSQKRSLRAQVAASKSFLLRACPALSPYSQARPASRTCSFSSNAPAPARWESACGGPGQAELDLHLCRESGRNGRPRGRLSLACELLQHGGHGTNHLGGVHRAQCDGRGVARAGHAPLNTLGSCKSDPLCLAKRASFSKGPSPKSSKPLEYCNGPHTRVTADSMRRDQQRIHPLPARWVQCNNKNTTTHDTQLTNVCIH